MSTTQTPSRKVEHVTLPPERNGFRVGYAHAIVDGQPVRVFTCRPTASSFCTHMRDLELIFGMGLAGWRLVGTEHASKPSTMKEKLTTLQRRAKAACDDFNRYNGGTFDVEWNRSATWGLCPRILWRGEKAAHASGCGYDKLSAVVAEFLDFLLPVQPDGFRPDLGRGAGISSVQSRLAAHGWTLQHTAHGRMYDGFRLSRVEMPS